MPAILTTQLKVLTPLYLAGADQTKAELRPPSIKGALRFWYRAIDPAYQLHEAALFGGTHGGAGQSKVILQVETAAPGPAIEGWDDRLAAQFKQQFGPNDQRNGLVYLGYPFQMKAKRNEGRAAIRAGTIFSLRCVMPRVLDERQRRGLLAALWLLGHLGSLGSRSRRGFGGLSLQDWNTTDSAWAQDMAALPLLISAKNTTEYVQGLGRGLDEAKRWFRGQSADPLRPHLGKKSFRCYLSPHGDRDWAPALNRAGRLMQDFRLRHQPDYELVKSFLRKPSVPPREVPERAAFGLPLRFQYRSLKNEGIEDEALFTPAGGTERHPSLLLIKLAQIGAGYHPLFIRLAGALPGVDPPAIVQTQRKGSPKGQVHPLHPLQAQGNLLDEFITHLETERK